MKHLFILLILLMSFGSIKAQNTKPRIYGEIGLGAGQTTFGAETKGQLRQALGGSFDPGITSNMIMAFYYSPLKWRGLGIGARLKGSAASGVEGDFGDRYFFNYYNVAATLKYYPFSRTFNKGLYVRTSYGFGQLTTKRANEETNSFTHQFAIGNTFIAGVGYSIPFRKSAISLEAEYESSLRSGTINGVGDQSISSGQVAVNVILSF